MAIRNIFAVSIGGILGSLLRWLISTITHDNGRPVGTLIVNFIGSGILLWSMYYFKAHPSVRWWWRPAITAGFCGGFTTYSAFAVQIESYLSKAQYVAAILDISVSLVGTFLVLITISRALKK